MYSFVLDSAKVFTFFALNFWEETMQEITMWGVTGETGNSMKNIKIMKQHGRKKDILIGENMYV